MPNNDPRLLMTIRFISDTPPTEEHKLRQGSQCKVRDEHNHNQFDLYIQTNPDAENPMWYKIGHFPNDVDEDQIDAEIKATLGVLI